MNPIKEKIKERIIEISDVFLGSCFWGRISTLDKS